MLIYIVNILQLELQIERPSLVNRKGVLYLRDIARLHVVIATGKKYENSHGNLFLTHQIPQICHQQTSTFFSYYKTT